MTAATHYLHKIRLEGRKSRYSAYYRADPICGIESSLSVLVDAERKDSQGRVYPCTQKEKDELIHFRHGAIMYY